VPAAGPADARRDVTGNGVGAPGIQRIATGAVTTTDELLAMQAEARRIYIDPALVTYAVRLVAASRNPAKAGLQGMARTLAIELGRFNINVNAVAPGFVETRMTQATAERMGQDWGEFKKARAEAPCYGALPERAQASDGRQAGRSRGSPQAAKRPSPSTSMA